MKDLANQNEECIDRLRCRNFSRGVDEVEGQGLNLTFSKENVVL